MQADRGQRSLEKIRERRKKKRVRKKLIHRFDECRVESLAVERLKRRWHERCVKYKIDCEKTAKEREEMQKKKEIRLECIRIHQEKQADIVQNTVSMNEAVYNDLRAASPVKNNTSPLLLDSVITPIQEDETCTCSSDAVLTMKCKDEVRRARHERNKALNLAQHYRNLAEESQSEKRILKSELEGQIEVVRNFWRNKIVEGGTRSGKILRAALIRE